MTQTQTAPLILSPNMRAVYAAGWSFSRVVPPLFPERVLPILAVFDHQSGNRHSVYGWSWPEIITRAGQDMSTAYMGITP